IEEATAAIDMPPAFIMGAARIGACEQEVTPFIIGKGRWVGWTRNMRFARIGKFQFRAFHLAIRATDKKHLCFSYLFNAFPNGKPVSTFPGNAFSARQQPQPLHRSGDRW